MKVSTRSSTTDKLLRGTFRTRTRTAQAAAQADERRREESELRVARLAERARPLTSPGCEDARTEPDATGGRGAVDSGEPAALESQLDEATYQCGCGYVFQAAVVTSVDCPHCGDSQAW